MLAEVASCAVSHASTPSAMAAGVARLGVRMSTVGTLVGGGATAADQAPPMPRGLCLFLPAVAMDVAVPDRRLAEGGLQPSSDNCTPGLLRRHGWLPVSTT